MTRTPRSLVVQFSLWTATAVAVQVILGVSWGDPTGVFDPAGLADAALVGGCVAGSGILGSRLSVRGRDVVGAVAATLLLTAASAVLFGASPGTANEAASLAGGYGVFVALAYTLGWLVDGVVRRGVVVEDGAATFDGPR